MTADKLAQALRCDKPRCKCGRKSGASWLTHCPAHDDKTPSLSLTDGDRVLLCCHAGCHPTAVIEALKARGLWQSAPSRNGRKSTARLSRYELRAVGGTVVAVHIRTDKPGGSKAFRWERPDGAMGLGGMPVSALPLYGSERLPALPDGARIVVCEGEKASDALRARGIAAVGTVTGAGPTPCDDALRPLARLQVTLWPDADQPGREHMARIGDALARLGCKDVLIVDWPGAPDKGDAADFDGTDSELRALLDGERTPTPDGAEVLDASRAFLRRYVALGDAQADAITLWAAHTWALDAADATPYLEITSAEKRSGKTRLLEVTALQVARPWLTGRTSAAALLRKVDKITPTLLLDESDAAFGGEREYAEALRGLLNSGYRRGGVATLCIKKGDDFQDFSVFCPKAIAGIGKLPDTIGDRAITIAMKRRAPGEHVERFRRRDVEPVARELALRLETWATAHVAALTAARPDIPAELDDRASDVWEPLLAIADAAGGDWPERARQAALKLSAGESREDSSLGIRLLEDIRSVFAGADRLPIKDLVAALVSLEEAPWADLKGKPLNSRRLGWWLRDYGIKAQTITLNSGLKPRGYLREWFADAWSRYTPGKTDTIVETDTLDTKTGDGFPSGDAFKSDTNHETDTGKQIQSDGFNYGVGFSGVMDKDGAPPDACAICGDLEIEGWSPAGEPRCKGHFIRETDGPLVRAAVGLGVRIVSRKPATA